MHRPWAYNTYSTVVVGYRWGVEAERLLVGCLNDVMPIQVTWRILGASDRCLAFSDVDKPFLFLPRSR